MKYSALLVFLIGLCFCWVVHAATPQGKQRLILAQGDSELNAYDLDDGSRVWTFKQPGLIGGSTPAVDQEAGILYYQSRGTLLKRL